MALAKSVMLSMLMLAALITEQAVGNGQATLGGGTLVDDEDTDSGTAFFGVDFESSRSCEEEWFRMSIINQVQIKEQIRQHITQAIENQCSCDFTSTYISNGKIACDPLSLSIQYTGIINSMLIDSHDSSDLLTMVRRWAMSGDVVTVSQTDLSLSPYNVVVENDLIDSSSGDFSATTEETPTATDCIPNVDGTLCIISDSGSLRLSSSLAILFVTATTAVAFLFKN